MAARDNFFLLLELDPTVDDWPAIEERLREKRRAWSYDRSQGNPKARRRAERNLALLPEIEALLKDPESRRQEAREAKKRGQEERKKKLRELDEAIGLMRSGGTCDEVQLKELVRRFGKALSADGIKKRLRAAGVELATTGSKRRRQAKERIDEVTASSVRRNLSHLGLKSLYEFLELRPQSSPKALADRADEIYKENQRLGKTDADASAKNELAGLCKKLFRDDGEKEKYDNTLAVEAMEGLKDNIELAGRDSFLDRLEMDELVKQARQRGVSAEDARAYLEDYATHRKWGVQQDAGPAVEDLQVCGFCAELAPAAASQCPGCGEALELSCPACGTRNPSRNAACTGCGFRIGDAPLVKSLVKEGERLTVEGDLSAAVRCFDKALLYWPEWQPAIEAKRGSESRRQEREETLAAIEKLVAERRLAAARTALGRFERHQGGAGLETVRRRVEEGLARAETAFGDGERRRRTGDLEAALDSYDEALAACADYEPALAGLRSSPPPPPSDLAVEPLAGGFRLQWRPAGTRRGVAYRVQRKAGGAPRGPEDGTVAGEVRDSHLDDPEVPVGEAWYYAVFTTRSGVPSHEAARSGPHLRTAEVTELEAVSGDREVTLRWTRPPGCRRVTVWRKRGAVPSAAGDGTELPVAGDGIHDAGLENGRSYGYRVVVAFADPRHPGRELLTAGKTVTVVPVTPPAAVEDLRASREGTTAILGWTPVAGASVQLRRSSQRPGCTPGQIFAVSQLDRFGAPVAGVSRGSAQIPFENQGRMFVVPFSVAAGTAVAGRAVEVTHLDPIADLVARRTGGGIHLTWAWPPGVDQVIVCHDPDRHPEDPRHHGGAQASVTRREYERDGGWLLRHPERVAHYFSVFAKAGDDLYAPAARALVGMGQTAAVAYRVVVKKALVRRTVEDAWIELTCRGTNGRPDMTGPSLHELLLVGKKRQVPLSPRDGEVLAEVRSVHFENGRAKIPIPPSHWRGRSFVKLFFKDAAQAREVRLLPAEKEGLRIG